MNRDQFHEIRLRDFRCFHDEQAARLAPLTLLVGDNSTGKTSFLAAVRAVWDAAFRQAEPDFREPPYGPTKPSPDPEGAYMPTYFASVNFQDEDRWLKLKSHLEDFGRRSGLFDEITVKQLGEMEGGPFQLQIRKAGKHGVSPRRNLIDVGYGVSQALPVLVELFRSDASPMLLLQQPEVHLHPSAQAALGTLFCETAAAGRQLVIETHSDYIVDRVLLDVRDRRTDLKAEDVSILYFEREDSEVRIHSIRVADDGSIVDAPEGYRRFFKDELDRVINY